MTKKVEPLNLDEGRALVQIARRGLERFVRERVVYQPDWTELPTAVSRLGCSFVTLTNNGRLRGCIGSTEPRWPLAEDVARHAAAAARDPRLPPVNPIELGDIRLEVTLLTPPQPLPFTSYDELLDRLRPGEDGVILIWRHHRSVLLPQVWRRIPDPAQFLAALSRKAGIPAGELAKSPPVVRVLTFRVQHFAEPGYQEPGS